MKIVELFSGIFTPVIACGETIKMINS